jgi:hypothetical protein
MPRRACLQGGASPGGRGASSLARGPQGQSSPPQHGWWQACPELNEPGYDPFSEDGANYNLVVGSAAFDPVSGSVPLRAYLCQVRRAE